MLDVVSEQLLEFCIPKPCYVYGRYRSGRLQKFQPFEALYCAQKTSCSTHHMLRWFHGECHYDCHINYLSSHLIHPWSPFNSILFTLFTKPKCINSIFNSCSFALICFLNFLINIHSLQFATIITLRRIDITVMQLGTPELMVGVLYDIIWFLVQFVLLQTMTTDDYFLHSMRQMRLIL